MADQIPLKTIVESGERKLAEFAPTDTMPASRVGIIDIGSGAVITAAERAAIAGIITDHGALGGLTDDDHPQYHNDARGDARYYPRGDVDTLLTGKADLVGGLIPAAQLPGYVDDVLEFANLASFPATGETGKIYVAIDTNAQYRWSGSVYVPFGGGGFPFFFSDSNTTPRGTQSSSLQVYSSNSLTLEAGTYLIEFSFISSINTAGNDYILELDFGGSTMEETKTQVEHKDSGGGSVVVQAIEGGTFNSGTNQSVPYYVRAVRTVTAGTYDLNVLMRNEIAGTEAAILASTLTVERKA